MATAIKQELLDTVLASGDLPTLPTVASKLLALTSREDTTLSDVADLISLDMGLSTKILKVSNSAFYSLPQRTSSIHQAVSMLGTNAVQSLVLSFSFLSMKKGGCSEHFDFKKFWEQSLKTAVAAKLILESVPGADTDEILVSGLLQNLGELILACACPQEYEKIIEAAGECPDDPRAVEDSILGADHCYIGHEVARHWNFPESICVPIQFHHDPCEYAGDDSSIRSSIRANYLADLLLKIIHSGSPEEYHQRFRADAQKLLGLKIDVIEGILNRAHIEFEQASLYFGLQMEETKSVQRLLQEANVRLSLLNLDYEQMNKELVEAKVSLENLTKELQEKNDILRKLADVDGLTGVYNNRYFQDALDKEISRTLRHNKSLSLVLIDIDHFKRFNDTHGHLVGDFVLTEFCRVLVSNLREYDTLARYGGEEFALILPETSKEDAFVVADKLRRAVETETLRQDSKEYHVTASFGVSCFSPEEDGTPVEKTELVKMADRALYEAKDNGRNQVGVYGPKKKWFKLKLARS